MKSEPSLMSPLDSNIKLLISKPIEYISYLKFTDNNAMFSVENLWIKYLNKSLKIEKQINHKMLETIQNIMTNVSSKTHSWIYSTCEAKTPSSPSVSWKDLTRYTLSEVSEHCHYNDCWLIVYDRVYDVTQFINEHPGGEYIVMENAGRDCTLVFRGSRHSKDAFDMLEEYCIGILVENERIYTPSDDELALQSDS